MNARRGGVSIFADALALGVSAQIANLAQGAATVIAAACTYWTFRRPAPDERRFCRFCSWTTVLAAPHIVSVLSDALLLDIRSDDLRCARARPRPDIRFEIRVPVALWIATIFNPPRAFALGLLTPPLICLFLRCVMVRTFLPRRQRLGQ